MKLNIKASYLLFGVAFGFTFTVIAWIMDISYLDLDFSLASLVKIHQNNLIHYIVDLAPFVLGVVFFILGVYRQSGVDRTDELQEYADRIALLINSTGEGIYGIDLNGECTFANQACLTLLGNNSEAELLGRNMHQLIHHSRNDGSPYPVEECKIYQAFHKGEPTHIKDEVLWRMDGSSFDSEYRSLPTRSRGKVIGAVVSFTDITARLKSEGKEHARFQRMTRF